MVRIGGVPAHGTIIPVTIAARNLKITNRNMHLWPKLPLMVSQGIDEILTGAFPSLGCPRNISRELICESASMLRMSFHIAPQHLEPNGG